MSPKLTAPRATVASTRFIAGEPMNAPTNRFAGFVEQPLRHVALLQHAVAHHRHPVAQGHRLDLVVGDVDGRRPQALVQPGELGAHARAQLGVEVRERLVHEERPRLADDRPPHRHPLALPAGELRRPAVHAARRARASPPSVDPLGDLRLRHLAMPQPEGEVLAHGLVRVERVALEHHRDVAVGRLERGDVVVADPDPALVTFSSPAIIRSSVDLPQPDGPTSTMNSPSATVSETSSTARTVAVVDLRDPLERDRGAHPFTALEVRERMNVRCASRKAISTGSVDEQVARHHRRPLRAVRARVGRQPELERVVGRPS